MGDVIKIKIGEGVDEKSVSAEKRNWVSVSSDQDDDESPSS